MIRLSIPTLDAKEEQAVRAVLKSGFLVQGKTVAQFEEAVARYLGVQNVVAVSSGTSALHLALLCLGIGPGDEVIIPDYTFPATANVVELCGAKPVIADIETDTYNIDPSKIERLITSKTKAIMPVHLFGQSADMGPVMAIARRHKLYVIEDAACSLGARYKDRLSGTIGDVGCFSFHPRKVITTGEGGIIVTRKKSHADALRILRNHGISATKKGIDFVRPGFNYRMTEMHAALGVVQMQRVSALIEARRKVAREYDKQLSVIPWVAPAHTAAYNTHVFQTYTIRVDAGIDRDRFIRYLRDNGVESNFGTYALHRLSFYKDKYRLDPADFPVAEQVFKTTVALPLFDRLTQRQIVSIAATIRKFR
jgi:perosamine synthetase